MSNAAAAAAAGAAAAAAHARMLQEEEEPFAHMAQFGPDWEFKIVRSIRGVFKHRESRDRILAEEAGAGWILVEVLDGDRARFGRPISNRTKDATRRIDPYRTWVGMSQLTLALLIALATVLFMVFMAVMIAFI